MVKKYIIALLFVGALNAQQDGPGNYDELAQAITNTDSEKARLEIAWQFHKLTGEQKEHLVEVAKKAAEDRKNEISYQYLYRDWQRIGTTTSALWAAYRTGKYAYDKGMEVKAAMDAGISLDGPQMIKAAAAIYSAEAAIVLAIAGGKSLYRILTMQSAKVEYSNALSLVADLKERTPKDPAKENEDTE